jgi:very-short-patch-repair endonuclease
MSAGRKAAETMTLRGTHSGWHTRRGQSSYPEKYFISFFEKENIAGWERDLKVGRWFIDFAFEDKKLAVEIDGRQHQDGERKQSDKIKDAYLQNKGWQVIRIVWSNPKTQSGKEALHSQIKLLKSQLLVYNTSIAT